MSGRHRAPGDLSGQSVSDTQPRIEPPVSPDLRVMVERRHGTVTEPSEACEADGGCDRRAWCATKRFVRRGHFCCTECIQWL
jgi:hypothetical protein